MSRHIGRVDQVALPVSGVWSGKTKRDDYNRSSRGPSRPGEAGVFVTQPSRSRPRRSGGRPGK